MSVRFLTIFVKDHDEFYRLVLCQDSQNETKN